MGRIIFSFTTWIFIISTWTAVGSSSNVALDKIQVQQSSEDIVQELLQQYADSKQFGTERDEYGQDTGQHSSALEGIREAIRRRFDLYISQVKEVHGLQEEENEQHEDSDVNQKQPTLRRHRRAVITADTVLPGRRRRNITQQHETAGTQVVRVVYPLNPQPFTYQKLSDLNTIQVKGESYLFGLEVTESGTYTCIYNVGKDLKPLELTRELTSGATKIEVCQIDGQIYVLPVEYNETSYDSIDAGSNLFRFEPSTRKLLKQQTIDTTYASAIHFWTGTGEEANDVYLSVAPEYKIKPPGRTYAVEVDIYRWQSGYFDNVYSLPAYNPQAIRHAGILSRGYLAIANYQDDIGSTSVYSEIFRYNHKVSKYVSFQKIRTHGAKSVEFFDFVSEDHEDHFLAIANHCEADRRGKRNYRQKSHILKYGLDRFIPFQTFETYGAFQFLSIKMDSKSFLVLGEISGVRIFQYNGWKFTETYKLNLDYESLNPSLINFRPFIHGSEPYFTIASSEPHIEGGVYALEFHQKNDYNNMAADLEGECKKALARIEAEDIPRLVQEVKKAPKVSDTEIILESSLEFISSSTLRNVNAQALIYTNVSYDSETSIQLARRSRELYHYKAEFDRLSTAVDGVFLRNEDRSVYAQIHFENVEYHGEPLKTTHVIAERLNGHRLNDFLPKLIHLDQDYAFDLLEMDKLITDQHIEVEKLNGDDISDFALKSSETPQTFREKNKFSGSLRVQSELTVDGLFDGIDLNTIDFLLKSGNQTFNCDINIRDSFVGNLIADSVNGVNLDYFLTEGVNRQADVRIIGGKHFDKLYVDSLDVLGTISGIDVNELFNKAIRTTGKYLQTFTGRETAFESLKMRDLNLANPRLNEKWNLDDFVSISNGRYELDSVEFLENTNVGLLEVSNLLNKIRVDDGELDIILKDSSKVQRIGNKVIETLHLEKDSVAYGLIDGVNLTNWSHEKRITLTQNRIRVGTFAPKGTLRIDEGIFIEKYGRFFFEGEDVTRRLQNSLLLNSTELPYTFRGTISFDSLKVLGNSDLRTVNRLSPSDWLTNNVISTETLVVRGQKTFVQDVKFFNSISAAGLYHTHTPNNRFSYGQNEEVLSQLEDVLINGRNQTIHRNSIFESLLSVDKLFCPEANLLLQGIPFQNLLLTSVDQSVEGQVKFTKPLHVTTSFTVNGNMETIRLNGYELDALLADTLMTHSLSPQVFKAGAKFDGGLTLQNIQTNDLVGGYNISQLLSNIVRKDLSAGQVIYGSLKFLEQAELKSGLIFTGTLNGITHEEWGKGYLLKSIKEHQVVHTPLRFKGGLTVKNLTVANGKVSNYDVVRLSKEILRIDQGGFLGVVYFTNTLIADINAKRVNGLNLEEDLLFVSGKNPQIITGTKSFTNGWDILGSLHVGYLSGIDYNQAAKFAYGKNLPTDNLRIDGNLILRKEPFFKSQFNGEQWSDILSRIWWTDEAVTISTPHTFEAVKLEGGAELEGLFAGVDLIELERNYLSRTKDQIISGAFVFEELVFESLTVEELILEKGKINGLDLNEFRDSVFLYDVAQQINFHVQFDELTLTTVDLGDGALIGGIDLSREMMQLHGPNVFEREVTLEELNVNDLIIGNDTLINEIHLGKWLQNSLIGNQPAEISGSLEFHHARFTQNIQVYGHVDGIKFSQDKILTLSGDQTLQGLTTMENNIEVKNIQVKSGIVNEYNIQDLVNALVLKDRGTGSLLVYGEKTFLQLLKADSVLIESLFQGYNINETLENLKPEAYLSSYFNESLEERYKGMAELALDLHQVADRHGVFLEYFELAAYFVNPNPGSITAVRVLSYGQGATLFVGSLTNEDYVLSWGGGTYTSGFDSQCTFKGILRSFVEIEREGHVYLVVSLSSFDGYKPAEALLESKLTKGGYGELEKSSGKLGRTLILKLESSGSWVIHQVLYGNDFGNVEAFQLYLPNGHVRHCAVTLALDNVSSGRAVLLCFTPQPPEVTTKYGGNGDKGMEIYQVLPIAHAQSTSLVETLSTPYKTFLVVSSGNAGSEVVDVWTHGLSGRAFIKESCIPAVYIRSLALTETAGGQVLLALATVVVADESQQTGRVYLYRYSGSIRKFEKIQSLHFGKVQAVTFQSFDLISTATELLYVQAETTLYVYAYKGIAGFVLEHAIPIPASNYLETTAQVIDGIFRAEVFVSSATEVQVYRAKLAGLRRYDQQSLSSELPQEKLGNY